MNGVESAGEEIERTLRSARDRAERRIAASRLWTFVALFVVSVSLVSTAPLRGEVIAPLPAFYTGGLVVYAVLLLFAVRRYGATDSLIYLTLVLDVAIAATPGLVMWEIEARLGRRQIILDADELTSWIMMMTVPMMSLILVLNILRSHARASIVGAVVASVVSLLVFRAGGVFEVKSVDGPLLVFSTLVMAMIGLVGVPAARAVRESLMTFARLQLLERYLPAAVVDRIKSDDVDRVLALGGRLETVTIVATDLRGFTALSEKLPPERVIEELNAYHGAILAEVDRHGGMLDKFIGDGSLIVFGLELQGAAPAADAGAAAAVDCARAMLVALAKHNAERASRGAPPLAMGIGVHTGPVIAGNLGAGRRREFTVIGDTVNTASRLEGLTKEAGTPILVSAETFSRLAAAETRALRALSPMAVRGKSEPVSLYAAV